MVERVVVVTKPSRLEELVAEYQTHGAAEFVLGSRGDSIASYDEEHLRYEDALATIRSGLPADLDTVFVSRSYLPSFLFREKDLVIVCGPDGLFVNLAQYVQDQLVIGVNPDPASVTGTLMNFAPSQVRKALSSIRSGGFRAIKLPFVKATIDGRHEVWGINDIFLGRLDQVSARYSISHKGRSERHSSSGVIVATAMGMNGWLKSVAAMVEALVEKGDSVLSAIPPPETQAMRFVVREPFPSPQTGTEIVTGTIEAGKALELASEMPSGGVVFSDGNVSGAVEWPAGTVARLTVGERFVRWVVPWEFGTRRMSAKELLSLRHK